MCNLNVFDPGSVLTKEFIEIMCFGKSIAKHKEIEKTIRELDEDDNGEIDEFEFLQIIKYLEAHNKIATLMPKENKRA